MRDLKHLKAIPLFAAIVAAFLISSCSFLPKEEETLSPPLKEPEKITYETVLVAKGTIENKIFCTGHFTSVVRKELFFASRGGRLKDIYVKLGDMVKKGDLIAELDTDSLKNDIALQEIQLKKTQINYNRIAAQSNPSGSGEYYDLELATLDLEMQKSRLNTLYQDMEKSRIVSPIDGEVVFKKDIKQQEYVNAYDIMVSVADTKSLQLQYSGDKVTAFTLGMKVDVLLGKTNYEGEIVATPAEAPSDADATTKESIRVKVKGLPENIEMGSNAIFSLLIEKRDDVIVLPKHAVNIFASRKYVSVLINDIREERDVELGVQTDTEVEIVKGLELGELVIVN